MDGAKLSVIGVTITTTTIRTGGDGLTELKTSRCREVGSYSLSGQSALADELVQLNPRLRRAFMLSDAVIIVVDVLVAAARLFTEDHDSRSFQAHLELLDGMLPNLDELFGDTWLERLQLQTIEANHEQLARFIEQRVRRVASANFQSFARRLLGAASYDRLLSSFNSDAAVVAVITRRMVRYFMPLAVAVDDCARLLSPEQLKSFEVLAGGGNQALGMIVNLDALIDRLIGGKLPLELVTTRPAELRGLNPEDITSIADEIHTVLEGQTREKLEELSSALARKVQGARDALTKSADGASQAANSLIEFIDRVLRAAFDEAVVLNWVRARKPPEPDLLYTPNPCSIERPTSRAKALCFLYAGSTSGDRNAFSELVAAAIVQARTRLQAIKHNDTGSSAEATELRQIMSCVEGFFTYAIRVGWAAAGDDELQALKARLP